MCHYTDGWSGNKEARRIDEFALRKRRQSFIWWTNEAQESKITGIKAGDVFQKEFGLIDVISARSEIWGRRELRHWSGSGTKVNKN